MAQVHSLLNFQKDNMDDTNSLMTEEVETMSDMQVIWQFLTQYFCESDGFSVRWVETINLFPGLAYLHTDRRFKSADACSARRQRQLLKDLLPGW